MKSRSSGRASIVNRAIIRERIRLAMGMSLRPENREHPGHLTQGLEESNIDEKYYEPL